MDHDPLTPEVVPASYSFNPARLYSEHPAPLPAAPGGFSTHALQLASLTHDSKQAVALWIVPVVLINEEDWEQNRW